MLLTLNIRNYILIDQLTLDFVKGFSVFTGETGAGKSILIDAIGIICGDKFTVDHIRQGQNKALIEAEFKIKDERVIQVLSESGFDLEDDVLIISREVTQEAKSSIRINGKVALISLLKSIGVYLVDIHSQHDTHYLLNQKSHLSLLDDYHKSDLLNDLKVSYQSYKEIDDEIKEKTNHSLNETELDYLKFQVSEIEEVNPQENEDTLIEEELKSMLAYEKNHQRISFAIDALEDGGSFDLKLHESLKHLKSLEHSNELSADVERLENIYFEFQDVFSNLKIFRSTLSFDETRMNALQERLYVLSKLKKKFGNSLTQVFSKKLEMMEKIALIENRFEILSQLEKLKEERFKTYLENADKVSQIRKNSANELENAVLKHIKDLYLSKAQFKIEFSKQDHSISGYDRIEFLVSMNPGEPLRPLVKVASGGELSRLMLGLKVVFNHLQKIETVIFDEIDAGVSGRVASSIGEKMLEMSKLAQVFSVTHLAQVAAYANAHYQVSKKQELNRTETLIIPLSHQDRVLEMSMLLSGSYTESSQKTAIELLENAQKNVQSS